MLGPEGKENNCHIKQFYFYISRIRLPTVLLINLSICASIWNFGLEIMYITLENLIMHKKQFLIQCGVTSSLIFPLNYVTLIKIFC